MSQKTILDLPVEMMSRIFHLLPPHDLKSVVMVCKPWSEIGEDPKMWTWSVVAVISREDFHKLKFRRLQLVRELKIGDQCRLFFKGEELDCKWTQSDWIELFELLLVLPALVKIRHSMLCFWDHRKSFSFIEPCLLVNVFRRLEEVCMGSKLSSKQMVQLSSSIAENKSCVKKLIVSGYCISQINPELFASAVSNVEEVVLSTYKITDEQFEALFMALARDQRRLRKLRLSNCSSQNIEPALMGEAVNRLEEFYVENTWVKVDQLTAIMMKIVKGGSKLTKLMLCDLDYRDFRELDFDLVKLVREEFGKFLYFDNMNSDEDSEYMSDDYEEDGSDHDDSEEDESDHDDTEKDVSAQDNKVYTEKVKKLSSV